MIQCTIIIVKWFPTCDLGFIDANGWINGISFAIRDGKSFDIYSKKIEKSLNSILKHLQPSIHLTLSTQHITTKSHYNKKQTGGTLWHHERLPLITYSPRTSCNLIFQWSKVHRNKKKLPVCLPPYTVAQYLFSGTFHFPWETHDIWWCCYGQYLLVYHSRRTAL